MVLNYVKLQNSNDRPVIFSKYNQYYRVFSYELIYKLLAIVLSHFVYSRTYL